MNNSIEDIWDVICVELEILEDKEKQDLIREYGRRIKADTAQECYLECLREENGKGPCAEAIETKFNL